MKTLKSYRAFRVVLVAGLASSLLFSQVIIAPPAVHAAAFFVNSLSDSTDANPGDGICATSSGVCTIRAAVQEANTLPGADIINIPAGTYTLRIATGAEDSAFGDFDIFGPLTIIGAGAGATILDGGDAPIGAPPNVLAVDRLFEIHPTAGNVAISRLTVQGGWSAADGGGIYNVSPGTLRLESVAIDGNASEVEGGGIYHDAGRLIVTGTAAAPSVISNNTARGGGGIYSGGLMNASGVATRVEIAFTTFEGNTAEAAGGGVEVVGQGLLTISDSAFTNNATAGNGGGVSASSKSSLTVSNSNFTGNRADGDGGGLYSATEGQTTITGGAYSGNSAGGADASGAANEASGGGLYLGGSGSIDAVNLTVTDNSATGEGGGIAIDNGGSVAISDSTISENSAGASGGGIVNAGRTVTFTRLKIFSNTAAGDGGGIESQSTGNFTINDSAVHSNIAASGGGFANAGDGTLRVTRTTFWDNRALAGPGEDSGLGGGIYSLGDAAAEYTNVTIAGNLAQTRAGGLYTDADAGIRVVNSTIAFNSSPIGSGVADEGTNLNLPVPSTSVIFRNTIVAGNIGGTQCNFALGSEGGNLENGDSCMFRGPRDRSNAAIPGLDAVADNGGSTLTMALQPGSLAIDGGVTPCPATDQRGVTRPQNTGCDIGAYEYTGPFPPADNDAPDTFYLTGPIQDTEATSIFTFGGSDNATAPADLIFECRLIEFDPSEPPEPVDPTQPIDPALAFLACPSPWQVQVIEAGSFLFEVRAIDRAGNVDPTPASYQFTIEEDVVPPQTFLIETPSNPSGSTATFTFAATDNATPAQFLEFECRFDSNDPLAWLECSNPAVFSNLTAGQHTFQVRATDGSDNIDPSPATYTWNVGVPESCDAANITLFAAEDSYVDEGLPLDSFGILEGLIVRSAAPGNDARSLVRFVLPPELSTGALADCELESATMRLYASGDAGRSLQALAIAAPWTENTVNWQNQPGTIGAPALASSGEGYRSWNLTSQVAAMIAGTTTNYGFLIRDSAEEDLTGADQSFISSEAVREPPTPPQLVLRFADTGAPPPPPPAEPVGTTAVVCGQEITASITLQNGLFGCMGEGLIIGAHNIVVDLNDHTISSGMVIEPGEEDGLVAGIRNAGYDNVIIRNGTVRGFGFGVRLLPGTTFNVVEDMEFFGNVNAGVELYDADNGRNGNIVRDNYFEGNGYGLLVTNGSENSVLANNRFFGNGNLGIELFDASGHLIENNTISGLTNNPLLDSDGGIELLGSSDNIIRNNELSDSGDAGLALREGSNDNLIENNRLTRASDSAISIDSSDGNQVLNNTVHLAGGAGIGLGNANNNIIRGNDVRFNPGGIELAGSNGNLIENNNASDTGSTGISAEGGESNIIRNNLANNNNADGISVEAETLDALGNPIGGFLIEGNQANNNLGNGIGVGGSGHTITNNDAYNNAAFGISAAEGNIDGGLNEGAGNGEPLQCVGVVCSPGAGAPPSTADLTPPDTAIVTFPANGSSTASPATFTFTGSDNNAPALALRFECRLDAPPDPPPPAPEPGEPPQPPDVDNWLECASPQSYQFLLAGSHRFEVRAVDPSDNVDLTPAVYTWTAVAAPPGPDGVPPTTAITAGPSDPSTSTTATFSFTGSDNTTPGPNLVFECRLDSSAEGDFAPCTSPRTYTGLAVAPHTFEVRAVDLGGMADASPASYSWTINAPPIDTTPPETTINSGPELVTVSDSASFSFSSNEAGATFECSLDGAAFTLCTSPQTYTSLAVQVHTFQVRAVDAANNADPTPAEYTWELTPALVPTVVSCGQVITQNTLVLNSLANCLGDGLVVGADRITIDLGGNTIDGTSVSESAGIRNDGFDDVTIVNGTITEFDAGVVLSPGSARNLVSGMDFQLNPTAGVSFRGALDSTVRDSSFGGNGDSIQLLDGAQGNLVRNNDIAGSVGLGLAIVNASNNRIEENTIAGSGDQGIELLGATFNRLTGNSISGASDTAFGIEEGSNDNYVAGNTVVGSEAGINVSESSRLQLIGNRITGSSDNGISLEMVNDSLIKDNDLRFNTGGIQVGDSINNRIEANILSDISGIGLELGEGNYRNVVVANIASDNDADGIVVGGAAPPGEGNLIERNTANGNSSDGIVVEGAGHIILRNEANGNAGWGIYASGPSTDGFNIDGGYNSGQGNGEPLQCYNVNCDGGAALPLDTTPPETTIESAPSDPTFRTSATFTFSGQDNGSGVTFACRLSPLATDFTVCVSPVSYTGLTLGNYTFEVRASDFLGNTDPTPASYTWAVQAAPPGVAPETFIDSGPDSATASTSASFVFSSNEEDVSFECALDGGAFSACSATATFTNLPVGLRTLAVRAVDVESIVDATPATYSWTITAAPTARTMSCGQLVTQSTILANNLTDCNGNGLVIGASNIVLDLNGRTIDGINLGVGILNNGFDNVVITNGFIQEFDFAVQLNAGTASNVVSGLNTLSNQDGGIQLSNADQGGVGNIVRNNTISGSINGVALIEGSSGSTVRDNTISAAADNGVYLLNSNGNRVEDNTIFETSGAGVALEGSSGNTVIGNALTSNSGGGVVVGVELFPSNNNRIEGNTIRLSGSTGISVVDSSQNELVANSVREASGGISLDNAQSNQLLRNDIRSNSGGIALTSSNGNRIEANIVSANSDGIGLEALSLSNVIVRNTVTNNSGEGIYIADPAPAGQGNRIEFNTVSNNSAGIFVNGAVHSITGNVADLNDGWGIYAVAGNIDGGGNVATGNAEPLQCFTIVCVIGAPPGAPDTTIVERPTDPTNSRDVYFTFTGVDNTTPTANLGFQCRLDSSSELAWVDCENPQYYTSLAPGLHVFEVRAVDENEFVDPTPASYTWTYLALPSGVAPDTFINIAPPLESPLLEGIFTFSSNEPNVTFQCSLDLAPFTPCEFAFEFAFEEFELGLHTFRVRAIDFEGNVDPTPASYTWTIGGLLTTVTNGPAYIAPEQPGEPAEGGETEATTATFTFESNVADSTFLCSLDLGPYVSCASGVTYTGLSLGEHVFFVYAVDSEGREQLEPTEYSWTIIGPLDTVAPNTTLLTTPANNTSEVIFTFAGTDNVTVPAGLTFECSLDGVAFVECASPLNLYTAFPDFVPGTYTFSVRALDAEDNIDATPAEYTWTSVADTVAPTVLITAGPVSPTIALEATLSFTIADNTTPIELLTVECSLDGGPFEPCASPYTVDVEPGLHVVQVRAVDLAGNISTVASYTWLVVGPPVTTIVSGPAATTTDTTATFAFSANQSPVTYECSLNGSAFAACATPFTLTDLGGGSYELAVQATNSYGLVEEEPVTYTWVVQAGADTTPPNTTISSGPPVSTASDTATFAFASSELNSSFQCQLSRDGAVVTPFTGCETPYTWQNLLGGVYLFEVRAVDAVGNTDPTPASFSWTVLGPPTTLVTLSPLDPTEARSATFEFTSNVPGSTFECSLDGAAPVSCTSPLTYADLAFGTHNFFVYATAPGGYIDEQGYEYEWTILEIQTTLTAAPPAVTTSTDAAFSFAASVDGSTFECSLDGAPFAACVSGVAYTGLPLGEHTFRVRATSPTGNLDTTPASYTWEIEPVTPPDVTAPTTTLVVTPPASTTNTEATFTFSASEINVVFECALDGGPFGGCVSPVEYNGLEPIVHTFQVRAIDAAGNVGAAVSFTWEVLELDPTNDTTPPDTTITVGPEGLNGNVTAVFEFIGSDNLTAPDQLTFECALDGGAWAACDSPAAIQDLTYAQHTFAVRAIDAAGNVDATPATRTWTVVDAIAPDTSIDATPTDPSSSVSATFTFSADEAGATFECALDGADFTVCTSPTTYTGLNVGAHTFRVRAVDAAGNADATPDTYTWTVVGAAAPDTTITAAPPAMTESTEAILSFASDQPNTTFECSLNGAAFAECESPYELSDLAIGSYTLQVRAVDLLDQADPTPASASWTVVAPAPAGNTPAGSNVTVVTEAEGGASTATVTFGTVSVAGNTTVSVLTSPPALPSGFQVGALTYDVSTTASFSGSTLVCLTYDASAFADPASVRLLHYEGGAWVDVTSVNNPSAGQVCGVVTSLSPFAVAAPTATGTSTPPPVADTTAPETEITVQPPPTTASTSAPFVFTANEDGATFECSLDGAPFAPCTSPLELTGLTIGTHTFSVRAIDAAGNTDPTPATYTWAVEAPPTEAPPADTTAPETSITGGPASVTTFTSAMFSFAADEAGATFTCSLDGTAPTVCSSPVEYTGLGLGLHTFSVRAADAAGNGDQTPASYSWTIEAATTPVPTAEPTAEPTATPTAEPTAVPDTSPPNTTLNGQPAPVTMETAATFTFSADEAGATFECSLDGAAFTGCASPAVYTGLAFGAHTFDVRATDAAGNVDASPARAAWTIVPPPDTTAPDTAITGQPAAATADTSATFTFSSNEAGSTFLCSLDGAAFAACASPAAYTGLTVGNHIFSVYAVDPAGNADTNPASYTWTITPPPDTTAPDTTLTGQPPATTADTSATFAFVANEVGATFQCSLDGGLFAACASPAAYTGLAVGNHTFSVRAVDLAGNADASPASYAWTITPPPDTTAPDTTLTSQPASSTLDTYATFTFSANEAGATFQCALDGGAYAACASPVAYTGLAAGNHTFSVRAVDPASNADATPATFTWTVQTPIVCAATTVTVGANADAWIDQKSPTNNKGTDSTLKVQSKSSNNNFRALVRFSMPATVPNGCVVQSATLRLYAASPKSGRTLQAIQVNGSWTENGVNWNNQPVTTGAAATTASGSNTGYRQWDVTSQVQAMYAAGANNGFLIRDATENTGSSEQQFNSREKGQNLPQLVIQFAPTPPPADTTPPETTITGQPPATTADTAATLSFASSESGSTFQCSLDGTAFGACASPMAYTSLGVGLHSFAVRAIDTAGNVDPTPVGYTWTVTPPPDTTPPDTTITGQPAATTTDTTAMFAFSGSEAGSTFTCSLDGAPFAACVSPVQFTALAAGAHTLSVRATDLAGNTDATPASVTWTVEAVQTPTPTATPNPTPTVTNTPTPTSEPSSTATSAPTDSPTPTAEATPAPTGTPTPTSAPADTTAPETTVDSGPAALTQDTSATFTFSANEAGSTFECALDGGAFAICTSPATYSGLTVGSHTFAVRATDGASNADSSPATYAWTVEAPPAPTATPLPADTTPPETTIDAAPAATTADTNATFAFSSNEPGSTFLCSLNGAAFAACVSPMPLTGLAASNHTFSVYATDPAGNVDASPATVAWTIQAPAPTAVACTASTITVGVDADAWIDQNSSGNNYGSDSILKVQSKAPTDNFRALLRFAMPASVPQGCVVQSATLRLFAASATSGRTLEAWQLASGWSEGGVTWSNQPATTGIAATAGAGNGYLEWNVTSLVQGIFAAGANHGFLIRDAAEGSSGAEQQFHGREKGENLPQLVITFGSAGG